MPVNTKLNNRKMDTECYSTIYTWFEKSGIISNLRSQLRQNLVNALKNNDLFLKKEDSTPKSAKQYVYDLLIAEYLFNLNYAYTLSVFASEAPLLVNFHKYTSECQERSDAQFTQKLQNDYIWHVLETLGIQPNDPKGEIIISEYANSEMSLLLCILKCLINLTTKDNIENTTKTSNFSKKEVKSCQHQCTQTDFKDKNALSSIQLIAAKKKLLQQRDLIDSELREKEMRLKEQALIVDQQLCNLNKKLEQVQNLMHEVNSKEKNLVEERKNDFKKEMELALKEKLLSQETDRLEKERDSYRKFETDLKKLQEELIKVQKEIPKGAQHAFRTRDIQVQTVWDHEISRIEEMQLLNKEKQDLLNLVQEQQSRIEQLTLRAVQLSRQLEEIHLLKSNVEIPNNFGNSLGILNAHTMVSESSSTEDILQDAKMRLKRLEEESLKAEQHYYNCFVTSP